MRRLSHFAAALLVGAVGSILMAHPSSADTHGNTDLYEGVLDSNPSTSAKGVASPWWSGSRVNVNQRYGCTNLQGEPTPAPRGYCVAPYDQGWHQGIDIGLNSPTTLYSTVSGTVVDYTYTTCLAPPPTCPTLGKLGIRTLSGNVVYLLHGSPTANYARIGQTVNVGDAVYTSGGNGTLFERVPLAPGSSQFPDWAARSCYRTWGRHQSRILAAIPRTACGHSLIRNQST